MKLRQFLGKSLAPAILFITVFLYSYGSFSQTFYLVPKFSLNCPIKGGDVTTSWGGGLGYFVSPIMAVETTYLRVLGRGDTPDNNIIEFDTVFVKKGQKMGFFMQFGSGFYKITDPEFDSGLTGLMDFGIGLLLGFVPSLNLRLSAVYYSLFSHKDLITGQAAITLDF